MDHFYEGAFSGAGIRFAIIPLIIAALVYTRKAWGMGVVAIVTVPVLMTLQNVLSPLELARLTQTANLVGLGPGLVDVLGLVMASAGRRMAIISMSRRTR